MRYLNRIIFINSAAIRYSEIQLDGNIHFIGTQGVGKSTILRAILFFYNADAQRLGIPVEKKSYQEYYFPYALSLPRIGRTCSSTRKVYLIRRTACVLCWTRMESSIARRYQPMRNIGISYMGILTIRWIILVSL